MPPSRTATSPASTHTSAEHLKQDGRVNTSHPASHSTSSVTMSAVLNVFRIHSLIIHASLLGIIKNAKRLLHILELSLCVLLVLLRLASMPIGVPLEATVHVG